MTNTDYDVLTFDCYGTLIDWHGGILAAAGELASLRGCDLEELERDREAFDRELILGPYRPYGEILGESLARAAARQGRTVTDEERGLFAASMADWPPFEDSRAVLRRLAGHFRLAILSNVETRVLESSVRLLDAPFAALITAERLGSYKPARRHFEVALEELGARKERLLHVACSLYHDVEPAQGLGIATAFVNRDGLAVPEGLEPRYVTRDLARLAGELGV